MPRIPAFVIECIFYAFPSEQDALKCSRIGGSGFFVATGTDSSDGRQKIFAVTNFHVARNTEYIRLERLDGDIGAIRVGNWRPHPNLDDLAICALDRSILSQFKVKAVSQHRMLSKEAMALKAFGVGDDTLTLGRFVQADSESRHMPVVRFGRISTMPIKIRQAPPRAIEQESFLVECWSYSGYSGSPVWVYRNENIWPELTSPEEQERFTNHEKDGAFADFEIAMNLWLLGVNWGHTTDICRNDGIEQGSRDFNTGLMCVLPAWKLLELLSEVEGE